MATLQHGVRATSCFMVIPHVTYKYGASPSRILVSYGIGPLGGRSTCARRRRTTVQTLVASAGDGRSWVERGSQKQTLKCGSGDKGEDVRIRFARKEDVDEMAMVTAKAFSAQDALLLRLRELVGGRWRPFIMTITRLFEEISAKEVSLQLRRRVGGNRQAAHLVLVAEHVDTGRIVGCVEVGLVRIQSVANGRPGNAVHQWERSISAAESAKRKSGLVSTVGNDVDNETTGVKNTSELENRSDNGVVGRDSAAYMGNLAVSPDFRRLGVATALVTEACCRANLLWATCVWLHVEEQNTAATTLYKKLGFGCETQDPAWSVHIGRSRKMLLRSKGGTEDWSKARTTDIAMNGWEYLRWCIYDLKRVGDSKSS